MTNGTGVRAETSTIGITRTATGYVAGGKAVDASKVDALVRAIAMPIAATPTVESVGLDREHLGEPTVDALGYCPGIDATDVARDAYWASFYRGDGLQKAISEYYARPDRAGQFSLRVTVTQPDGSVEVESRSRKAGMLPWSINSGKSSTSSYDGAISRALQALIGWPAVSEKLSNSDALAARARYQLIEEAATYDWQQHVCTDELRNMAMRAYLPKTFAYIESQGMRFEGFLAGSGPKPNGLGGDLTLVRPPNFGIHVNADSSEGDATAMTIVSEDAALLQRAANVPWLQRLVASDPQTHVYLEDPLLARSPLNQGFVDNLRAAGQPRLADRLARDLPSSVEVYINRGKTSSTWFLLSDDDMIQVDLHPGPGKLVHPNGSVTQQ